MAFKNLIFMLLGASSWLESSIRNAFKDIISGQTLANISFR